MVQPEPLPVHVLWLKTTQTIVKPRPQKGGCSLPPAHAIISSISPSLLTTDVLEIGGKNLGFL